MTLASSERAWLRGLPKVELHVHLEGSMSVATAFGLTEQCSVETTTVGSDS